MRRASFFFVNICLLIFGICGLKSQTLIDLGAPLNDSTFNLWNAYIHKYAPADSAFRVVEQMTGRHYLSERAAVAKYIYERYQELFPKQDSIIKSRIFTLEQVMISQTPQPDTRGIYHDFILKKCSV